MFLRSLRRGLENGRIFISCKQRIRPYSIFHSQPEGNFKNKDMPHIVDMKQGEKVWIHIFSNIELFWALLKVFEKMKKSVCENEKVFVKMKLKILKMKKVFVKVKLKILIQNFCKYLL